ncbi:MAG: hypothetical protein U0S12_13670 [Fimbriimonadales bacterium]
MSRPLLDLWFQSERMRHRADPRHQDHLAAATECAITGGDWHIAKCFEITGHINTGKHELAWILLNDAKGVSNLFSYLKAKLLYDDPNFSNEDSANQYEDLLTQDFSSPHEVCLRSWALNNLANLHIRAAKSLTSTSPTLVPDKIALAQKYLAQSIEVGKAAVTQGINEDYTSQYYQYYNLGDSKVTLARAKSRTDAQTFDDIRPLIDGAIQDWSMATKYLKEGGPCQDDGALAVLHREIGTLFYWVNNVSEARNHWTRSKQVFHLTERLNVSDRFKRAVVEEKLRLAANRQRPINILPYIRDVATSNEVSLLLWTADSEKSLSGYSTIEEEVYARIAAVTQDAYTDYLSKRPTTPVVGTRSVEWSCNRGWASSIPLIMSGIRGQKTVLGGGYNMEVQNQGFTKYFFVIDPGHNYINNFHLAGHTLHSVTGVFVSHDHGDHSADTISLDDVLYDLWNRSVRNKQTEVKVGQEFCPQWILNNETFARLKDHYERHQASSPRAKALLEQLHDSGRMSRYEGKDSDQVLEGRLDAASDNIRASLRVIPVEHDSSLETFASLWTIRLGERPKHSAVNVLYTADMCWPSAHRRSEEPKFQDFNNEQRLRKLIGRQKVDVLVAHMSQPDPLEYLYPDHVKRYHLGMNGLVNVARLVKPRYLLVGEFWGGLSDHRLPLVNLLLSKLDREDWGSGGRRPEMLPMDMGFRSSFRDEVGVRFEADEDESGRRAGVCSVWVYCSHCGEAVTFEEVSVVLPDGPFGRLQYLCLPCLGEYQRSGTHDVLIGSRVKDEYSRRAWERRSG